MPYATLPTSSSILFYYALAEKSSYLAFKTALLVIGVILWVTGVIPLLTNFYLLPKHYSDTFNAGLGLGMAILVTAYYIAYLYHSRLKKMIEGK